MTAAVDKRDFLVKLGKAKPGRGKFSNEAKEILAEAERNGIVFVDKKAIVTTVRTTGENGEVKEEKREYNPNAPHPPAIRTGTLTFTKGRSKIKVNATEACHNCHMSFGWCYCELPAFLNWKDQQVYNLAL